MADNAGMEGESNSDARVEVVKVEETTVVTQTQHATPQDTSLGGTALILLCNKGYLCSWQALLKILKMVFLLAMVICAALMVSEQEKIFMNTKSQYQLGAAIVVLVLELAVFLVYLFGVNFQWEDNPLIMSIVITIVHSVGALLVLIAAIISPSSCIYGPCVWNISVIEAFLAFAVITFGCFVLELYFNAVWMKKDQNERRGPELVALPCVTVDA